MFTLNTILLVCLIAVPATVAATVAFIMLLGVYLGVKEVRKVKESESEDGGVITIPLSQLSNMGMGAGRPITQADVDRARAAMAQHAPPCGGDEKPKAEYDPPEGAYI